MDVKQNRRRGAFVSFSVPFSCLSSRGARFYLKKKKEKEREEEEKTPLLPPPPPPPPPHPSPYPDTWLHRALSASPAYLVSSSRQTTGFCLPYSYSLSNNRRPLSSDCHDWRETARIFNLIRVQVTCMAYEEDFYCRPVFSFRPLPTTSGRVPSLSLTGPCITPDWCVLGTSRHRWTESASVQAAV